MEIPYALEFRTTSGLFEFVEEFQGNDEKCNKDFPMRLLATMPENWLGSVVPESEKKKGFLNVKLNPRTMKKYGLQNGNMAILESEVGYLVIEVLKMKI